MAGKKIKVLGIAPYEGMKSIMHKMAAERDDIDLTVYVGDLGEGVEIARRNFHSDYDVIISRGGTAEMISEITTLPLVEISLSVYDILRAIKLAENYSDRYAIVGFPSITNSAKILCDLLHYTIDIYPIHSICEVKDTLTTMKAQGYRMVLCDMITQTTARSIGLNAILITSGNEGITSAFDQAVKLHKTYVQIREDNRFLMDVINGGREQVIVLDEQGHVYLSASQADLTEDVLEILRKEIPESISSGIHKCFRTIGDCLYAIASRSFFNQGKTYIAFYFSYEQVPAARSKYGIKYYNRREAEEIKFNDTHSLTGMPADQRASLDQIAASSYPVMITGQTGTGKEQVAIRIYTLSQLSANPLILVDCLLISDKGWGFLTNHYNSPLNDSGNTLFFKDLQELPEVKRHQLLTMILDTNIHKRNRLMLSYSDSVQNEPMQKATSSDFINELSCLTVKLEPLRHHSEEIPTLSSLYLSTLNLELAKQIIGFEPEALALLQDYGWPDNYTQFKRVLNELAVLTTTPYITTDSVRSVLGKEKPAQIIVGNLNASESNHRLPQNKTLDDMNREIILRCLDEENGNHSATAKRLGISRTTLWRYLK